MTSEITWPRLRELMLSEPKPPLSFVVHESGARTRSARVLHDGGHKWLIWSSEKLEINDGERAVVVSGGRAVAHKASELYSHGWIKSLIHPWLTNLGDGEDGTRGRLIGEGRPGDIRCWRVEVEGLRDGEDARFTLDVHKESGVIVAIRREDAAAEVELKEFVVREAIAASVFSYIGAVDEE